MIRCLDPNLSGCGDARSCPEGQPSPRADSMSASQGAISQQDRGFHTVPGGTDAGDLLFRPRVDVIEI